MEPVTAFLISLFATIYAPDTFSIQKLPQNYFSAPLEIPLETSGSFGEPRRLHFHTGLDLKTQQREGLNVLAVADGYVSRINVSGGGYGNALYITHPNGYVSVYGHLQKFSPKIEAFLRKEQYEQSKSIIDFCPAANEIHVNKGEIIALSGNSGGSGGPHLHFEIRDTQERIINPLLFGYRFTDNEKPLMSFIKFYPTDNRKLNCDGYRQKVVGASGSYKLASLVSLNAEKIGVSVNCWDAVNKGANSIGIYDMRMWVDGKLSYQYTANRLAFNERRCVCSHVDYPIFMKEGRKSFHKCFVEPGNHAGDLYTNLVDFGQIDLSDGKVHAVFIEISDFNGNRSELQCNVVKDDLSIAFKEKILPANTQLFTRNKLNVLQNSFLKMEVAGEKLFDDMYVSYTRNSSTDPGIFSSVHKIGEATQLLDDYVPIQIRAEYIPGGLEEKMLIVYKDLEGKESARVSEYNGGWLKAKTREMGTYYVKADTVPPKITPLNIVPGRNMRSFKKLLFRISDGLSGISTFNMYIDNYWVVCEYDAKNNLLKHELDVNLNPGSHEVLIEVDDERKNKSVFRMNFGM